MGTGPDEYKSMEGSLIKQNTKGERIKCSITAGIVHGMMIIRPLQSTWGVAGR